ncbi:cupin domain-containing protein [Neoroseomonas oryzicola]|uniref:Cupin domain-containing protein n=1 Tax=Neoroseomonas oryzicola TaxID=535904 RepID=A0A9X9WHC4_9PROT|nr:cupin domain-containing protein [Neoroseomonas oryzicola]MBR0659734.1 cupin domain-containing protein [Neoroseomonas oryzicola]NKE17164.1 cupin domain-containing protein [Neoroseomonas oryzicola]
MEPQPRIVRIGALELRFHVDETDGAGDVVMFEFVVPEKARVPVPHFHEACDEIVYGLEGTMTTTLDGVAHEVRKGEVVFVPRGKVHHHANLHEGTARAMIVIAPGTIGRRYFEEMAELVSRPGPPDVAQMKAVMLRHGLVPA